MRTPSQGALPTSHNLWNSKSKKTKFLFLVTVHVVGCAGDVARSVLRGPALAVLVQPQPDNSVAAAESAWSSMSCMMTEKTEA